MIMEYMCHGDLLGFLSSTRGHTDMYTVLPGSKNFPTNLKLKSHDLFNIINQVANGMLFLSEKKVLLKFLIVLFSSVDNNRLFMELCVLVMF